ncbi:MAG: NAD(P)/FAD-dependent oxidoreductase [Acidobacteria bacterium]|nr:NAD(P)/FAD-dependent oxidoreductase [Acidobacteriota bacterium]
MADARVDVAVVGAGPAGGHLARLLVERGLKVLLADRLPDLRKNAFSSAGTTLEALDRFRLPGHLVGAFWKNLSARSSNEEGHWSGVGVSGAVLDFGSLREHLAREAEKGGAQLCLGCKATSWEGGLGEARLRLERGAERFEVKTGILVDATGPARGLMRRAAPPAPAYLVGTGLEWLVEVPPDLWDSWRETLAFFLGRRWIPRGYSWIFPMQEGLLKVGAGRFNPGGPGFPTSLEFHIRQLLGEVLKIPSARVLDVHGGTLRYARGLKDPYAAGPLIGVGDAVSTLNTLGGEGIRHAMEGAEIALPFILRALGDPAVGFGGYAAAMHRRFKGRWDWSEELAVRRYLQDGDGRLDSMIRFLRARDLEFVLDVLFNYNFPRAARAAGPAFLWSRLRRAGARAGALLGIQGR